MTSASQVKKKLEGAYNTRLTKMERDTKEVKEKLEKSIMMSDGKKEDKPGGNTGRRIRVWGHHHQYNGTDAVNYNMVTYTGIVFPPHQVSGEEME